eukprot:5850233-Heterocapsa_arctica.AAC.1
MAHSVFHPSQSDIDGRASRGPSGLPAASATARASRHPGKFDITFAVDGGPADARAGCAHGVPCPDC